MRSIALFVETMPSMKSQSGSGTADTYTLCLLGSVLLSCFQQTGLVCSMNGPDCNDVHVTAEAARHWLPFLIKRAAAKVDKSGAEICQFER